MLLLAFFREQSPTFEELGYQLPENTVMLAAGPS
jgi:hypothetical protein